MVIQQPGFYLVSFHGSIGPASGVNFPLAITLYLKQQGTIVQGTAILHTFQTSSDTTNVSFVQLISVTETPTTLTVVGEGGNYLYTDASMSVYRLGENSTGSVN